MTEPSFDALPDPLRTALERRGYTEPTAVQSAVLAADDGQGDLLISSQTGSGKTVALGFAVRDALLAPLEGPRRGPTVLAIAPTRELAAQLAEELGWLFAEVGGLSIDVVTGGTSVRGERERLERPPAVLVGTPGRLLDHLEAGALDLSGLRELVLDEADQMLDLGFRDELESILAQMPPERRTHMVSATFPRAVRELAERYQREAVHVEGTALGAANADIEHIAVRVHPADRYAALVNLLLLDPDERTLIFVATRAGAAQLADRLAEDGFGALPLSGDLAQAQRTRTLAAFKTGVARILVATDVAARGLDLPDVGRVVHTSPAMDGEAFTHRSGRTGRAGKRGQSVVLVTPRQERKVRWQLSDAGVDADWRPAPGPDDVRAVRAEREGAELAAWIERDEEPPAERVEQARALLDGRDPQRVLARLLDRGVERGGPAPRELGPGPRESEATREREPERRDRERAPRRPFEARHSESRQSSGVRFQINWGFHGGANPKRILAHICRRGGIEGRDVGAIKLFPRSSTFEIAPQRAGDFERRVAEPDQRDPHLKIRRWIEGGPPERERAGDGDRRPPYSDRRASGPGGRGPAGQSGGFRPPQRDGGQRRKGRDAPHDRSGSRRGDDRPPFRHGDERRDPGTDERGDRRTPFDRRQGAGRRPFLDRGRGDTARRFGGGPGRRPER